MLNELHIENIAVIEKADIDFSKGLNILTGETGAGKSIVIDSIGAVLGCEVEIETIDKKKVGLKVPAGISYGTRLRIPNQGVRRRGGYGSLLVRIVIATPKKISSRERELYEQILAAENGGSPQGTNTAPPSGGKPEGKEKKKKGFFK